MEWQQTIMNRIKNRNDKKVEITTKLNDLINTLTNSPYNQKVSVITNDAGNTLIWSVNINSKSFTITENEIDMARQPKQSILPSVVRPTSDESNKTKDLEQILIDLILEKFRY